MIVFKPVVLPAGISPSMNGKLGPCQLTAVTVPGVGHLSLHPTAARAWNALQVSLYAATGLSLSATGAYRSYDAQVQVFEARYTPTYNPLVNVLTSTRTWLGKKWYLRRKMFPVAVPGTSNHGLGIAVDMGFWTGQHLPGLADVAAVTDSRYVKGWDYLTEHAERFGWSWEGAKPGQAGWEPHHIRYVAGDNIPQAVLDVEAFIAAHS